MQNKFYDLFGTKIKPVIGMLHLVGENKDKKIRRALDEVAVFEEEGIDGVIVEDYHGTQTDVEETLDVLRKRKTNLVVGVNLLRNPCYGLELARKYGAKVVQLDNLQDNFPDLDSYNAMKQLKEYEDLCVFGGIRFKYIPLTGKTLEEDLADGRSRCEVIVTTGDGTGIETPTEKLREFRKIIGNYPLIVGAGVNSSNVREQLNIADGAIVGSFFKNGYTENLVDRERVKELMSEVRKLR